MKILGLENIEKGAETFCYKVKNVDKSSQF